MMVVVKDTRKDGHGGPSDVDHCNAQDSNNKMEDEKSGLNVTNYKENVGCFEKHLAISSDGYDKNGEFSPFVSIVEGYTRTDNESDRTLGFTRSDKTNNATGTESQSEAETGVQQEFEADHERKNENSWCSEGGGRSWAEGTNRFGGSLNRLVGKCSKISENTQWLSDSDVRIYSKSVTRFGGSGGHAGRGRCLRNDEIYLTQLGKPVNPAGDDNDRLLKQNYKCVTSANETENKRKLSLCLFKTSKVGSDERIFDNNNTNQLQVKDRAEGHRLRSRSVGDASSPEATRRRQRANYRAHLDQNETEIARSVRGRTEEVVATFEARIARINSDSSIVQTRSALGTPDAANVSRAKQFFGRFSVRKSISSFGHLIASFLLKPTFRKSSDLTPRSTSMGKDGNAGSGIANPDSEEKSENVESRDVHKDDKTEEENEVFLDDKSKQEDEEEEEEEECSLGAGWVKARVTQLERQISTKKFELEEESNRKSRRGIKRDLSMETIDDEEDDGSMEHSVEFEVVKSDMGLGRREVEETGTDRATDEEDSDTEVEEEVDEEFGEIVTLRSRSRNHSTSLYRYSSNPTSTLYRYSVVRPRTVIIGLGVCTETKFFSESFGDGVSETESDDEEEDGVNNAHTTTSSTTHSTHTTPDTPRPASPTRISRPHSPLSDMDVESKRNSQAVSTEPSDLEDHSSVTTSDRDSCHDIAALDARKDRSYRIALELLHTERTYVKVLHLIDQEFQFRVDHDNRATHMFPAEVIPHMFSNVKSIYKLHHDFLLPQLEDRMAQWHLNPRIGDIMKSFAPFLKMYTEYVRNFDNAMTLINQWQAKSPRFAAIMDDIHTMEACGNLTLQHHMLSPVQRIPRYEMLLRDYLRKLPEDSPDRHDTEKALHLVSTAANHANDAMKKIDKFEKLLEIQESLGGAEDLVSPTRELIKEGKIIKISARSGDHQERYIFLLTDLLLLCSPRLMGGRVMSGPQYRLRAKYHVENLIVQEGDNLETANTFYIKDNNKSVELYTQTIEEKEQWLEAFIRAIHETSQRKSSLKLHFNPDQRIVDVDLGQKQPMLIRSDSVTKCMECGSQFTMVRRKHHCRACGAVVCSKCSSFKASLAYECGKSVRVCRTCHATLQELSSSTATPSPEIDDGDECSIYNAKEPPDNLFRNRGVLEVSARTSGAVIQGFLQLKTHRKTWVRRWFALHTDFVLYSFKCEADDHALTATPVPGFTVTPLQGTRNESGISDKEKERAFKLHHAKKQYVFQAATKDESQRWVAALKKASQAELPLPVQ